MGGGHKKKSGSSNGHKMDAQFAVVEFPREKNSRDSAPISVVPMHWITAKGKKTFWPSKNRLTESELEAIVKAKTIPQENSEEWLMTKCSIMCTSRTYKGAVVRLRRLEKETAVSSSADENEKSEEADDDDDKSDNDNSGGNHSNLSSLSMSPFKDPSISPNSSASSLEPPKKKSKTDSHQTPAPESSINRLKNSTPFRPKSSGNQNLFTENNSSSTPRQSNFEHVVIKKLNEIYAVVEDLLARGSSRREAVLVKAATSLETPIGTLEDLLALDVELGDSLKQKNMVNYLCQFGGKNESEFLHRILSKLIKDKLCERVNWTGANREMAFRDSKHIISTLYNATRSHFDGATEASVESVVKLWFNKYKDRLYPRTHSKKVTEAPGAGNP